MWQPVSNIGASVEYDIIYLTSNFHPVPDISIKLNSIA